MSLRGGQHRTAQRPASRVVEVELVEDDAPDDLTDPDPWAADPDARPVPARLPRSFWAMVAVALVLGGAGIAVGRIGVDRMLSARLAEVDGLTTSLADPLREAWRTPGSGLVATADDVVVHWDVAGAGVVATDLHDGSTRYRVPGSCQLVPVTGEPTEVYVAVRLAYLAGPDDVLLCLDDDLGAGGAGVGARETTARVVDPVTGETRSTFAMVAGGSWTVVGGDVVSIGLDDHGLAVAGRWSLATGERRWAYQGTAPAPTSLDATGSSWSDRTIGLQVGDWSVTLDLRTGAETEPDAAGPEDPSAVVQRVDLPDGTALEYHLPRTGGVRTTVHPSGGGEPVTVPGFVLAPTVDDGSVPGAVMVLHLDDGTAGPELRLVDLATGETRWTAPDPHGSVGILAGLVLVAGPERTSAFDARTGERRWEAETDDQSAAGFELVTDGRRVLVLEGRGPERELVARDVRTGDRVWGTEPPVRGASLVPLPDGTVLAVGFSELAVLRP